MTTINVPGRLNIFSMWKSAPYPKTEILIFCLHFIQLISQFLHSDSGTEYSVHCTNIELVRCQFIFPTINHQPISNEWSFGAKRRTFANDFSDQRNFTVEPNEVLLFCTKKKELSQNRTNSKPGISERMHQYSGIRWTNWRNQRDKITQLFNILLSYREIYDIIINDKHKI